MAASLRRAIDAIDAASRAGVVVAALMVAGILLLMLAEIVARGIFRSSTLLSWEWSSYLMAAVIFLAAAGAGRSGGHIRVGLPIPPQIARYLEFLWIICAILVCAFLVMAMADLALVSYQRGIRANTPQQTPLVYSHGINAVGALLLELQLIARLFRWMLGLPTEVAEQAPEGADR